MLPPFKCFISIFSNVDLCNEAFSHEKSIEYVDTDVVLPSQEYVFPENAPTHQNDDLETEFSPLNQGIPSFIEDNIVVYKEEAMSDDHEEGVRLFLKIIPSTTKWNKK